MSSGNPLEMSGGGTPAMLPLDAYSCPLAGRNIVSAGAGTGKTYNIQILMLREVLSGVPIGKILVVTFTNLATNELKERLRAILRKALAVVRQALASTPDAVQESLSDDRWADDRGARQVLPCLRAMAQNDTLAEAEVRLKAALADFDSAPVSTIHSFCSRVLKDNAFESNTQYGLELRASCQAQMKALCADFFRRYLAQGAESRRRARMLLLARLTPESILAELKELFRNADSPVNWGEGVVEDSAAALQVLSGIENAPEWNAMVAAAAEVLQSSEACELLQECGRFCVFNDSLNWLTGSAESLRHLVSLGEDAPLWVVPPIAGVREKLPAPEAPLASPEVLKAFVNQRPPKSLCAAKTALRCARLWELLGAAGEGDAPAARVGRLLKSAVQVVAPVDSAAPSLCRRLDIYRRQLLHEACVYVRERLELLKARDGYMTYDDLLLRLKAQLLEDSENARRLRKAIQERFTCVMIDEFQDTDASQSAIFNALFRESGDADDPDGHPRALFMIGDEKQSIYKFRGGDVENFRAHLHTRDGQVACYTLDRNFRSSADFLAAVNAVRQAHEREFFAPAAIDFPEILPGEGAEAMALLEGGSNGLSAVRNTRLLSVRLLEKEDGGIDECLAAEIAGMTGRGLQLTNRKGDTRGLRFQDIAILLRATTHVNELRASLDAAGIPSVLVQGESIFKAPEGRLLYTLMDAVLAPGEQSKALLLLSTPLVGCTPQMLEEARNGLALANLQMTLQELNRLWQHRTIFQMLTCFLNTKTAALLGKALPGGMDGGVTPAQLLCRNCGDGGQALARLLQLGEELLAVELEEHLGASALLFFLDGKLRRNARKSFSFGNAKEQTLTVDEDENDDDVYPMHLTTQEDAVRIMTIHKSKGLQFPVVFVPGFSGGSRHSERIYHDGGSRRLNMDAADAAVLASCDADAAAEERRLLYVAITRAEYLCRFISKVPRKGTTLPEELLPLCATLDFTPADTSGDDTATAPHPPVAARFGIAPGDLPAGWVTTSFSSISQGGGGRRESEGPALSDEDDGVEEEADAANAADMRTEGDAVPFEERLPIFRFPGGKRTGTCWHTVFEQLDFQAWAPGADQQRRDSSWNAVVTTLEHYGQLGDSAELQEERLEAFLKMLSALCSAPLSFQERTEHFHGATHPAVSADLFRLHQIPMELTRREFNFTYRIRDGVKAEELRHWLEADGIAVPPGWSCDVGRVALTGSIDLLLQNPADGCFYILDWKTNIIGADPANFDADGVQAEADRHFYPLQCVIYALAFCQYYRQWLHGAEAARPEMRAEYLREAYGHFGGCADVFVRGLETRGGSCVCPVTPSLELLLKLDERIGVVTP